MLNKLLIGATVESLQDTLGVPTFRTGSEHGPRQLTWLTPHSLAKVCVDNSGAGAAFAVTVLYGKRWQFTLDVHRLSLGVFRSKVKLGRSTFQGLAEPGTTGAVQSFAGASRVGYAERHYFGRPGGYRYFVLAHTPIGGGAVPQIPPNWNDDDPAASRERPDREILQTRNTITINTLMVMLPSLGNAPASESSGRQLVRMQEALGTLSEELLISSVS